MPAAGSIVAEQKFIVSISHCKNWVIFVVRDLFSENAGRTLPGHGA
jgi:hypothetical protein